MRSLRCMSLLALTCAVALIASPVVAMGVPSPKAAPTASAVASVVAPVAQGPIDAQVWLTQDAQDTAVILDVQLDPAVKLPARVRIPVPAGAVVEWAGEIVGQDASSDQQRDFTLHNGAGGGAYAEFTMSVSHRGQIETSGIPITAHGAVVSTEVDFVQSVPASSTIFTVRLPAKISQVNITPTPTGPPDTNSAGESLYLLPAQTLATGASSPIKVSYNTSPPAAARTSGPNLTPAYVVLGVLLVGAVAFVVYLIARQGPDTGDEPEDEDEPEDGDELEEESEDEDEPEHAPGVERSEDEPSDDPFDFGDSD